MDHNDLIAAARTEADALVAAVGAGPGTAPVPSCPGWTVTDLLAHLADFTVFWTHVLQTGLDQPNSPYPQMPDGDGTSEADGERVDWIRDLLAQLLGALVGTSAVTPTWTWNDEDQTAGFVARRVAHELAIHRFDAELARGAAGPIDPALAVDGIDELLGPLLLIRPGDNLLADDLAGQTIHLHATDVAGEWLITLAESGIEVERTHAKGDLAVRAAASDLELALYQRPTLGAVEQFGDPAIMDLFHRRFTF